MSEQSPSSAPQPTGRVAGGRSKVLAFAWSVPGASVSLLQSGVDHYQVWTLAGRNISGKKGLYGTVSKRQTFTCCCWIGNEEAGNIAGVLGAHDGSLYRTDGGRKLADALPLHNGPVTALVAFEPKAEEGPCVISAGMDGKIKLLPKGNYEAAREIQVWTAGWPLCLPADRCRGRELSCLWLTPPTVAQNGKRKTTGGHLAERPSVCLRRRRG